MGLRSDLVVLVFVVLMFSVAELSNCGRTSSFVRTANLSLDMPLYSDVFRVPPGYNAPQQVYYGFISLCYGYLAIILSPVICLFYL